MDSWRVLFPWCKWLRGRLQLEGPLHNAVQRDDCRYDYWLLVTLPKHQRNASSDVLPKIRESLTLLSFVAVADRSAFCDILHEKCDVDSTNFNFNKLRVVFLLDDHTSRSLLWPETVCKTLLAWDGAPSSADFLLTKEEVEKLAETKMGTPLPFVDIPFCLHFAPRDINLVGLQQYLQSVQRVLKVVMPRHDKVRKEKDESNGSGAENNQDHGGESARHWPFVSEAVQLSLREFELNESVAIALKDLVMLGAKVSCLQLSLKSTDFLSEDECPRQPLADCLLAITGGGPRAQLFSSTFALKPQDDELKVEEIRCKVETVVINDVDIDDRRFAALCSALRGASGVRELVLESVFAQDTRDARALKWKWLAYALFTPNGERSSVKKLVINEPQLFEDDVAAIASIVNAQKPARELLDPLWAEHETHQRETKYAEKDPTDQQAWSSFNTNGDDMVHLQKDTVVYLEPLCSQDEWLQTSMVLEQDADFGIMNSSCSEKCGHSKFGDEEDWVEVLVPGYGKCWVHSAVAQDRYVSESHVGVWRGITDLSLVLQVSKGPTDKVLTQLFQIIGHDLVSVSLQVNLLREQGLGSILRSCPNLKKLQLNGAQVEDMFAFTHGYDVGYCQIESLSIEHFRVNPVSLDEFAKVLSNPDREAARHLRQLCVGKLRIQDIDIAFADYERMIEAFARMLDTNTTLEYLKLYIEGDFYTRFVKSFTMHNGEELPPMELSRACKIAFSSALRSDRRQCLGEHLVRLVFTYAARRVTREGHEEVARISKLVAQHRRGFKEDRTSSGMGNGDSKECRSGGGSYGNSKAATDNRANQLNPNNPAYYSSRGQSGSSSRNSKAAVDNRANQLNPNNPTYHNSRVHG